MRFPRPTLGLGLLLAALLGLAYPILLLVGAHRANGFDGFPLDDAWIHLTYARNLAEHHAFTYFPGDPTSAGSTSPLYTLLLAAGFLVTGNEKILSYALGLLFQLLFLLAFGAWARRRLESVAWAAVAVLLVAADPRIGILSVSGMETSLLLFLVALAFLARASGRVALAAVALGLAVWVRPDALVLALVFAVDALLGRFAAGAAAPARAAGAARAPARGGRTRPRPIAAPQPVATAPAAPRGSAAALALVPGLVIALAYAAFNEIVGRTPLPNTFAAKTAYYANYPRLDFLRKDVVTCFTNGAWLALAPFYLGAIAREALLLVRRRAGALRAEAGWAVALVLAYLVLLPFPHRFFRYLVPALPALALLALAGLRDGAAWLARDRAFRWRALPGVVAIAILALAGGLAARSAARGAAPYAARCRDHHLRHERTGLWLASHTPPGAVIATHDVGAIAFESGRRIVDMVGVVQRGVIPHLNRPDYTRYLAGLFAREKVTYVATLRNWQEVANVAPLFTADPEPEVLEVYPWIPGVTHLVPGAASALNERAAGALANGDLESAARLLGESLAVDSLDSRTWLLLGVARETAQRWAEAESAYRRATALFPDFDEALARRAVALTQLGRGSEAIPVLERLLAIEPGYPGARDLYRRLKG
jgi:hypothetical protein